MTPKTKQGIIKGLTYAAVAILLIVAPEKGQEWLKKTRES